MDKLDYLAQQEEQLRKLNEQLDAKKTDLLKNVEQDVSGTPAEGQAEKKDLFANAAWTMHEPAQQHDDSLEVDDAPEKKDADDFQPKQDANDEGDEELAQVQNYQAVLERSREQQQIINIQKAKINALQSELEDALKRQNLQEIQLDEKQSKDDKTNAEFKKLNEKIN